MRPSLVRALQASGRFWFKSKCELTDQNGMWRDVTNWLGTNWLDTATWTESVDQPVSTGTITLTREDRGVSLAPAIGASPANQLGSVYSPFLKEGRGARLSVAITPQGTAATLADFIEVFIGQYDNVATSSDTNTVTLNTRDLGARIVDNWVREKKSYATADTGEPLEQVIQDILDDNNAGVALTVPVPSGVMVKNVEVDEKSLLEAIRDVAMMVGWDVRYKYGGDGVSRLTLYQPLRALGSGAEMTWFAANEYIAIPRLDTSVLDVRNIVRVDFTNADTGLADFVDVSDPISSSAPPVGYGPRWTRLSFAAASTINTTAEATKLANFALSDLAYPLSDHDVELFPCFWQAQLGDWYGFRANGKVYDSDQSAAVYAVTHTLENASGSTTLTTKARVVGAFKEWLRRSGSDAGEGAPDTTDTRALALKNFREVRRTPTKVTYGWDVPGSDVDEIWAWGKLSPQDVDPPVPPGANEDRLWRDTKNDPPDLKLDKTTTEFEVTVPDFGNVQTWELVPVDIATTRGYPQRVKVLSVPDVPRITSIETLEGATGLFKDITALNVVDPQALGGTLKAWLNHDSVNDADPTSAPDGTITVAITPRTFNVTDVFTVPGGTAQLFDNVRIHPGAGKRVSFEFVNTSGISSGVIGFILLSNGGIITPDGQLKDESINRAEQVAAAMSLPSVYDSLPATGRPNELAVLTTGTPPNVLYRWDGTKWSAEVRAPDMSGLLVGAQLAAHIVDLTKIATNLAPPEIITGSLPTTPGAGRVALFNGVLYRSKTDGSGWTANVATTDLTGTIGTVNIALGAITTALMAAGAVTNTVIADGAISTPKLVAGAVTANELAAGSVTTPKLVAGAVTSLTLDTGAVTAGKVAAGAVTAGTIDVNAVTAGTIAAGAVNTTQLAANAVVAANISAGAVTTASMTANAISGDRVTAGTLDSSKITAFSIDATRMAANSIVTASLQAGAVTATAIHSGAVDATKVTTTLLSGVSTSGGGTMSNVGIIVNGKLQSLDGLRYLDLNATGSNPFLQHPSLALRSDGSATFSGALSAASGSFTGSLSGASITGATGTFSGALSGATGTFSGSLSAATGTFSGTLASTTATATLISMTGAAARLSFTNLSTDGGGINWQDAAGGITMIGGTFGSFGFAISLQTTGSILLGWGGAGHLNLNGGNMSAGANDSAGSGFKYLRVPNGTTI